MKKPSQWLIGLGIAMLCTAIKTIPKKVPDMVLLSGGTFATTDPQTEEPIVQTIKPFWMDKNLVTVAEFEEFTQKTGYVTEAERFGNSTIFDFDLHDWRIEKGANFRYPFGKNAAKASDNHPVTQVSWNDAMAYAKWKGKRLPTDAEWEWAAKNGGKTTTQYPWGDDLHAKNGYKANTWQGSFPQVNTAADGFLTTSPVGYFGESPIGLTDMGGNVWQWCADAVQPTGCNAELDLRVRKVCRGGSFLCDMNVCHGFKIGNRTNSTAETAMVHTGFRCVRSVN
ncbi:MAG: formylglycine-generating enzyme family protein [Spirosomataceae bacterium]